MLISNCCGAANFSNGDSDFADFGICPDCHEHCEFIDDEEEEEDYDPEMSIRTDNWGAPGSTEYNLKLKNETK